MKLSKLIKKLQKLEAQGYGKTTVVIDYEYSALLTVAGVQKVWVNKKDSSDVFDLECIVDENLYEQKVELYA
jgi:hypothetical protein